MSGDSGGGGVDGTVRPCFHARLRLGPILAILVDRTAPLVAGVAWQLLRAHLVKGRNEPRSLSSR